VIIQRSSACCNPPISHERYAGYLPEVDEDGKEKWPRGQEKVWKAGLRGLDAGEFAGQFPSVVDVVDCCVKDVPSITKSIVNHVQTSLARQAYNLDVFGAYQASALSVRDNLLVKPPHAVRPT
jgi:starch phosphorylase